MIQKSLILILLLGLQISLCAHAQTERDTLYYELESGMIDSAHVYKMDMQEVSNYLISVQLKEDYRSKFMQLTEDNIGNVLSVVYEDEVISPTSPLILTRLNRGRFTLGEFKKEETAKSMLEHILKDE